MYTLYYSQGACSVATQVVLRELEQPFTLVDVKQQDNFKSINPVGAVPVLIDHDKVITEGAAIMLYLLGKHKSELFPEDEVERQIAIQHIMFANATMHPAYSRLFFISQQHVAEDAKQALLNAAAQNINQLWQVVEAKLADKPFLGGRKPSAADIMLTVYSRWGAIFPVDIVIGDKTQAMLDTIQSLPNFIKTDEAEQLQSK